MSKIGKSFVKYEMPKLSKGDAKLTTQAVGEEGGKKPTLTTQAIGEEGGQGTTKMVGEEGGQGTTKMVGEEGGQGTTKRIGEEGGSKPPGGDTFTTMAVSEEGGVRPGSDHGITKRLPEEGGSHGVTKRLPEEGGAPAGGVKGIGRAIAEATKGVSKGKGAGALGTLAGQTKPKAPVKEPRVTTLAVGEEGGARLDKIKPGVTTFATGEEGGGKAGVTTFAAGEEGSSSK